MAFDVGNSAARVLVDFGKDKPHLAYVRTYPCKPGAKAYPGWHAFGFPWWEGDAPHALVGPGMTDTFAKRSNNFGDAQPGLHFHGRPEWFEFGLPEEAFLLTGDALPPRDCEAFVALDVQDIDSTGLLADYPDCSILQFDRDGRIKVEVGHTIIQQVVRWMGSSVGVDGGSVFDGVFNILFSGATVDVVDSNTVLVTVEGAGGLPPHAAHYSQTLHCGPFPDSTPYWGGRSHSTSSGPSAILPEWGFGVLEAHSTDPLSDDLTLTLPSVDDELGSGWWIIIWHHNTAVGGRVLLESTGEEDFLDRGAVVSECVVEHEGEVVLLTAQQQSGARWLVCRFQSAVLDGGTY